jgi:hypothetical protein
MVRDDLATRRIPAGVAAEAKALGVGAEALRSMYAAELLLHYVAGDGAQDEALRRAVDAALAALAAQGDEGFLAVAANARGNPSNSSRVDAMAKATWRPGLEATLLDGIRAASRDVYLGAPLRMPGGIDTPAVREHLRASLEAYDAHASNFAAAAGALASLGDPALVDPVAAKLRVPHGSGLRAMLLGSLGGIGGDRVRDVLVEYVRRPETSDEVVALEALARFDASTAKAEAEALLRRTGESALPTAVQRRIEAFLAR